GGQSRAVPILGWTGEGLAGGAGAVREPQLSDELDVRSIVVLRINQSARHRHGLHVAPGVVVGVGPQPALAQSSPKWHGPDREDRVVSVLRLVVRHPQRATVSAQPRIARPVIV